MFHFFNKQHFLRFCIDACCVVIAYMAAAVMVKHQPLLPIRLFDVVFGFSLIACWYYSAKASSLYSANMGSLYVELPKVMFNIGVQFLAVMVIYYILGRPAYRHVFTNVYLVAMIIVVFAQKMLINLVRMKAFNSGGKKNVLIIGGGRLGVKFFRYVKSHPAYGYNVVGVLDNQAPSEMLNDHYLGKIDRLQQLFNSDININEVIIALPNSAVESVEQVVSLAKNQAVHVRFMPDYSQFVSPGFTVGTFGGMLIVNPRPEPLEAFHRRAIKRVFDVAFSLLVLILLCSWLFPIVALIIKLNSKGPVFFKQLRSGKNAVPFYCYKFRSMYLNDRAHLESATKNDPRITLIGKILRKTNIDELPQFLNVLSGSMSVVGPRPHMVSQNRVYSKIISQYMVRQLVKPGVTGWAQVSGYRGEVKTAADMQNRIEHDVWYLEHWSFGNDIRIIFKTVWNMLKGEENAY